MPTLLRPLFLSLGFLLLSGCAHVAMVPSRDGPLPIIVLPGVLPATRLSGAHYVLLNLDYGMIIDNGAGSQPVTYYLFCRKDRRIVKTSDVQVFLQELAAIPDGGKIDAISKCSAPFYCESDESGPGSGRELDAIHALMKKKGLVWVHARNKEEGGDSAEVDDKHADFCYCETGFRILTEQEARMLLDKGLPVAAVYRESE